MDEVVLDIKLCILRTFSRMDQDSKPRIRCNFGLPQKIFSAQTEQTDNPTDIKT